MFDIDSREYSDAYFAEEEEYKMGIHPTQVKDRIEQRLYERGVEYKEITFLDWNCDGSRVKVSVDGKVLGIFNYEDNDFEEEVY